MNIDVKKIFESYEGQKFFVFGAGIMGKQVGDVLLQYGIFQGYIDNDIEKQLHGFNNQKVLPLEDFLNSETYNKKIIIAASENNMPVIADILSSKGLKEGIDFWKYNVFLKNIFPYISYYIYNKIYVELAQICVTERCTLKCKKCAHGCNKVLMNSHDIELERVYESADNFFEKVDFVKEFDLIGGEPFLYNDLAKTIDYIGEKYRDKILIFAITTNGTIIPNEEIKTLCLKYNILIRVSDYSDSIPKLKNNYERLYDELSNIQVDVWKTNNKDSWYDYGFFDVDNGEDIKSIIRVFKKCSTSCREIRGDKYYYCVMARSVSENVGKSNICNDYLLLSNDTTRDEFFEYEMGYLKKGYLDMCRYCRGTEARNYKIPAAEQEKI